MATKRISIVDPDDPSGKKRVHITFTDTLRKDAAAYTIGSSYKYAVAGLEDYVKSHPHGLGDFPNPKKDNPWHIVWNPETERAITTINNRYADSIQYKSDMDNFKAAEFWTVPKDKTGDCEDKTLGAMEDLVKQGFPRSSLFVAQANARDGDLSSGHAFLGLHTDQGLKFINNWNNNKVVSLEDMAKEAGLDPAAVQARFTAHRLSLSLLKGFTKKEPDDSTRKVSFNDPSYKGANQIIGGLPSYDIKGYEDFELKGMSSELTRKDGVTVYNFNVAESAGMISKPTADSIGVEKGRNYTLNVETTDGAITHASLVMKEIQKTKLDKNGVPVNRTISPKDLEVSTTGKRSDPLTWDSNMAMVLAMAALEGKGLIGKAQPLDPEERGLNKKPDTATAAKQPDAAGETEKASKLQPQKEKHSARADIPAGP